MREVCFLLANDKILRVYFGSTTSIPDSRERWETIWSHRDEITEIAHSHPGNFLDFSHEDLTTMQAVEAGTGKSFIWSIVTEGGFLSRSSGQDQIRADSPWWLDLLRKLSYSLTFEGAGGVLSLPTVRKEERRERGRVRHVGPSRKTIKKRKEPIT